MHFRHRQTVRISVRNAVGETSILSPAIDDSFLVIFEFKKDAVSGVPFRAGMSK